MKSPLTSSLLLSLLGVPTQLPAEDVVAYLVNTMVGCIEKGILTSDSWIAKGLTFMKSQFGSAFHKVKLSFRNDDYALILQT